MDLIFISKAQHLAELRKWKTLKRFCKAQLSVHPNERYAKYYIAIAYLGEGRLEEAKSIAKILLSENSDNAEFMSLYVAILIQEKQYIAAESMMKKILARHPADDFYLAQYAKIKLSLLQFKEATAMAKKALAINPANEGATNMLMLAAEFQRNSADYQLDQISGISPNNSFVLAKNIEAFLQKGERSKAYNLAKSSLSLHPHNEHLKSIAELAIGAQSKVPDFLRKVNFRVTAKFRQHKSGLSGAAQWIVLHFIITVTLFHLSHFFANIAGYFIFTGGLIACFYLPVNKSFVLSHEFGRRLYNSVDKKLIYAIRILIILGLILLPVGLLTSKKIFLLLSLAALSNSVPLAYLVEAKDRIKTRMLIFYIFNLSLSICSYFISTPDLLLVSLYINCLFVVVYATMAVAEIAENKT